MSTPASANGASHDRLTERLNANSKKIHKRSNAMLLAKVATLFTDRTLYGMAIGQFYPIFVELEGALRAAVESDERIAPLKPTLQPLWRVPAYEADLAFYLGPDWRARIPASKAVDAYVARLREVAVEWPLLLLAHTFTQHTAGLSGGRVVKRMARKYMHLPEDQGTAIFEFPGGVELKEAFKARLDAVGQGLSEEEVQAVLDEQIVAFEHNIRIMKEFKIGLLPQLRAPLRLLPPHVLAAAAALLAAVLAAVVYRRA
ncbi:hypothetical protein ABPG75_008637 [Micractinium tetrahymenae]